jgi:hypothetical protein
VRVVQERQVRAADLLALMGIAWPRASSSGFSVFDADLKSMLSKELFFG